MARVHDDLAIGANELIVVGFAGGGGSCEGITRALGRPVDIAINHDPEAVAMHRANHPDTEHYCQDIWAVDPKEAVNGRAVGLAWFSPDCKHFSKAKGGKPVEKSIRDLAWVVVRWARDVSPRVILLENVEEFRTWGPIGEDGIPCPKRKGEEYQKWIGALEALGYTIEWRELRANDYGAPTIRKRFHLIARRDSVKVIAWPEQTHGAGRLPYRTAADCIDFSIKCHSIFLTKAEGRAAGCNRPLAENTMRRIGRGVWRYVINAARPFIVPLTHPTDSRIYSIDEGFRTLTGANRGEQALIAPTLIQTGYGEAAGQAPRSLDIQKSLGTAVAGGVKHAVAAAHLAVFRGEHTGRAANDGMPTVTANSFIKRPGGAPPLGVVATFLAQHNTGNDGHPADEPVSTIISKGCTQGVVAASMIRHFGESVGSECEAPVGTTTAGGGGKTGLVTSHLTHFYGSNVAAGAGDLREPIKTVTADGLHAAEVRAFLIKYYGAAEGADLSEPMHTTTVKPRFGLVVVDGTDYEIVDIGLRMLTPRELFNAQGFRRDYIIDRGLFAVNDNGVISYAWKPITKTASIRMCGNSVCPDVAEALVRACFPHSAVERKLAA